MSVCYIVCEEIGRDPEYPIPYYESEGSQVQLQKGDLIRLPLGIDISDEAKAVKDKSYLLEVVFREVEVKATLKNVKAHLSSLKSGDVYLYCRLIELKEK